jgi:DNA-binding transcriptional LysR family regulator
MNMMDVDLRLLRAFKTLVTQSNVTRAADRLGISQPAMSTALRRLRAIFDDPILIRAPGGSVPTLRALELVGPVMEILERVEKLSEPAFEQRKLRSLKARISLIAADYTTQIVLPRILKRLQNEAPGVQLDIRLANRGHLHEAMERGESELGIAPAMVPTGRLHFRPLFRERGIVILNKALAFANDRLTLKRFCELPHVVITPNVASSSAAAFFDEAFDRELYRRKLTRRVALTLQYFLSVPHIVATHRLVATVPARLLSHAGYQPSVVVRQPLIALPEMVMGMFWHERTHKNPLHRWFRDLVRQTLQGI